jgi:RNA polymerase sigma-70 factor, ECF subfamily
MGMDDAELIAGIVKQDPAAFEQAYDRYAGRALGFAMRMLAERTVAEELVQEAFWRVWKRSASFDAGRGNFATWLLGIVHHLVIDELRRRRGQTPVSGDELDSDMMNNLPSDAPETLTQVSETMQRAQIRTALAQLPEAQRSVIELAYFEGFTHQEIAARLQEPIGTIHTRARLGLLKLRMSLAELRMNEQ